MLLGFKRRFAPFVEDGTKTHTIRGERKTAPRVGETCHCYVDPRQKSMRLLGRWPCTKIEAIQIWERTDHSFTMRVEGVELTRDECNQLAFRDGFRERGLRYAFDAMMAFWMTTHGNNKRKGPFLFEGHIIHWNFSRKEASV